MPFGKKPAQAPEQVEDGLFRASFDRKPLLFLHIPKTAGTSFRASIIRRLGGTSRIAFDYGIHNVVDTHDMARKHLHSENPDGPSAFREWLTSPWTKPSIVMFGGHFGYQWRVRPGADDPRCEIDEFTVECEPFLPVTHVVTFVREPIARVYSTWEHHRRCQGEAGSTHLGKLTLMEFAALPLFRNLQSRYLKGVCLDDVLCLGVTERYHESLQLLELRTGLKLEEVKANVNPKTKGAKYQIDEEDEKVLRDLNAADLALYAEANERLTAALAAANAAD